MLWLEKFKENKMYKIVSINQKKNHEQYKAVQRKYSFDFVLKVPQKVITRLLDQKLTKYQKHTRQ